jgi:hypothetical protein
VQELLNGIGSILLQDEARTGAGGGSARNFGERLKILLVRPVMMCGSDLRDAIQEPTDQRFVIVEEALSQFDVPEQFFLPQFFERARFLVLPCLLQVCAFAGAVESSFALRPATLRTNAVVQSKAETLFFAGMAERTGQGRLL